MGDMTGQSLVDLRASPPVPSYRSLEDLPDALTQAKIIDGLEPNPADRNFYNYSYLVCNHWDNKWQKYLGRAEKKSPGQTAPPGPVTMNTDLAGNRCVSGTLWKQIIKWYGVSPHHHLRRSKGNPLVKFEYHNFEFGFLNTLLDKMHRKVEEFCYEEDVGYVEFQLRYILKVPKEAKTRLWFCLNENQCTSHLKPLLDREVKLRDVMEYGDNKTEKHVLLLEVQGLDGCWPSGRQETPCGDITGYYDVIEGYSPRQVETFHIAKSVEALKRTFTQNLTSAIDSLVSQTSETLSLNLKATQDLYYESQQAAERLQLQKDDLAERERQLEVDVAVLTKKQIDFAVEKSEFDSNKAHMDRLNKITDTNVTLNIGGHIYQTSTVTLTSDPDSMLAKMFGGRYPIRTLEDGSYFIDRNGSLFHYVLDYLRTGCIDAEAMPDDQRTLLAVYREADFYQISGLADSLHPFIERFGLLFHFGNGFFSDEDED